MTVGTMRPLDTIRARFGDMGREVRATPEVVDKLFQGVVESAESVPELSEKSTAGDLVKFKCFVQDVFEQEIYFFRYGSEMNKTAICCDQVADPELANQAPSSDLLSERLPLYCVSIPGRTKWSRQPTGEQIDQKTEQKIPKRKFSSDMGETHEPLDLNKENLAHSEEAKRGKREDVEMKSEQPATPSLSLNLPIPSELAEGAFGVVVKIYDNSLMNQPLLNQMVEVVGIVEEGETIENGFGGEDMETSELGVAVRKVHAISVKKLNELEAGPFAEEFSSTELLSDSRNQFKMALPELRQQLVESLRSALMGDELAAEYALTNLVSRVERRTDTMVVGKISLNFIIPKDLPSSKVISTLEALCPRVHVIPVTIQSLNTENFVPKKNYAQNRLQSSRLQLPEGTVLVLDETNLEPGQLNERGLKNLSALKEIVTRQMLNYDFEFYQMEVNTNIPVLSLSRTKSLLPFDDTLVCREEAKYQPSMASPSGDTLRKLRLGLTILSTPEPAFEVPEPVSTKIENQFVEMRRQFPAHVDQDTLHRWLSLARARARTYGESGLTEDRWNQVISMYKLCKERSS
ncbi:hypothetical protein NDN08_003852 [Rhodosorus marinus]|uniref:Mini-chromosome maintenance complex-binding protein n=1 Tax=Rhodosorus marinus TaxID=101924 RepID=A0AAV8UGM2_9RHOD|nr:hypothetical protein NDN08_003852 [Rhodosorus marinus]